jgi:hypothetical protein
MSLEIAGVLEIRAGDAGLPADLPFRVEDWAAYGLGLCGRGDWLAWSRGSESRMGANPPASEKLPPLLRRRVTPNGQTALRAASDLGHNACGRFVFCSRHGEFQRTLKLLETIAVEGETSPAEFSLSVHNALAGLLSIAWQNTGAHTAIAAGSDSFASGLLEAVSCLAEQPDERVLLVYFDEPLPGVYGELGDEDETAIAIALLLGPAHGNEGDLSIAIEPARDARTSQAASKQALDFLRFFLSGASEGISTGTGKRWRWRRVG